MNREERRKEFKGKKKYFKCPRCNFKHKIFPDDYSENKDCMVSGYIMCDCGINALLTIKNGYIINIDKLW